MGEAKNLPSVSVVIPHYGDPALAGSLVDGVFAQTYDGSIEVVVVDDCSPIAFPETAGVRLIQHEVNGGFGAAVNTGARAASGELLFILNSDLTVKPDFVARMTQAYAQLAPAIISPKVEYPTGESQWEARRFPTTVQYFVEWLTPLARFRGTTWWHKAVGHIPYAGKAPVAADWVMGAAMILPTQAFIEAGAIDESFYMYCEEVELQKRLAAKGYKAFLVPEVVVVHEGSASTPSASRRKWMVRSRYQLHAMLGKSVAGLRAALTLASVANFAVNLARSFRNRNVAPFATLRTELSLVAVPSSPQGLRK